MLPLSQPALVSAHVERHIEQQVTRDAYLADARTVGSLRDARQMIESKIEALIGCATIDGQDFEVTNRRDSDEIDRLDRLARRILRAHDALLTQMPSEVRVALGLQAPTHFVRMPDEVFRALLMAVNRQGIDIGLTEPLSLRTVVREEASAADFGRRDAYASRQLIHLGCPGDPLADSLELSYEMEDPS